MEERTMTFSINGDFITRLAREKCHYEGKMEYAMNLLENCLESDEITDNERKGLAFAILDGRAEVTGTYPGDDYRFHYLDQRDEQWNIARTLEKLHEKAEQAEKELHQVEEKLGFVTSGYMSSWDRREAQKQYREETGEELFVNMEEEGESIESTLLDSFIKRMESETDDEILREEKEIECIKYVAKRAIEKGIIERLKEKEKKKSYKLTIKAFKAFVKAETLLEKQNAEALKERAKGENA